MTKKLIKKYNRKYYLFFTGFILFIFVGCSASNLEKKRKKLSCSIVGRSNDVSIFTNCHEDVVSEGNSS